MCVCVYRMSHMPPPRRPQPFWPSAAKERSSPLAPLALRGSEALATSSHPHVNQFAMSGEHVLHELIGVMTAQQQMLQAINQQQQEIAHTQR